MNVVKEIKQFKRRDITELTGMYSKEERKLAYQNYTIFFMTPQTFVNDIQNRIVPLDQVVLVIFDEAHRAMG